MKPRKKSAFTLVELLVVITIIGMLVALVLPAINSVREAGRQTTCMNNQRNYGQALMTYVTAKQIFPGYRQILQITGASQPNALINWRIAILPYMEKDDVYQAIKSGSIGLQSSPVNKSAPYVEFANCPSDNTIVGKSNPWTSYVANAGLPDNLVNGQVFGWVMSNNPPADSSAFGIFVDRVFSTASVSLTDIKDGTQTTLMLSENLDAYQYSDVPIVQLSNPAAGSKIGSNWASEVAAQNAGNCSERGTSFVWWDTSDGTKPPGTPPASPNGPNLVAQINGAKGDFDPGRLGWNPPLDHATPTSPPSANSNFAARPSSAHPGGVIVVFAGVNTRFVKEDIDYRVYCLLMTTNGEKVGTLNPGWQKAMPLDEGAF